MPRLVRLVEDPRAVQVNIKGKRYRNVYITSEMRPRLREYILCVKAIHEHFRTGAKPDFRRQHYQFTLRNPFFNPGPIDHPAIPIYIAGVNPALCRLAGEVADGFLSHPYHSVDYLRRVVRPAIDAGAARAGRHPGEIRLTVTAMTAVDDSEAGFARMQIAFYASTPTYRPVMAHHGWGEAADRLQALARRGAWDIDMIRWMGEQQGSFGPDGHLYSRKGIGTTLAAAKPEVFTVTIGP